MSQRSFAHALDEVAQKWRVLAERRRAHLIELFHSGRWKHYYSEQQFLDSLREAVRMSERWAEIAPSPGRLSTTAEPVAGMEAGVEVEPVRTAA